MGVNNNKSVKNQIRNGIYAQLWNHTRNRIWYYDCDKVWDQITIQARDTFWESTYDPVWDQVWEEINER